MEGQSISQCTVSADASFVENSRRSNSASSISSGIGQLRPATDARRK
jgi:hypothetical protein